MTSQITPPRKPRGILSARRIALMASAVAGFGALALVGSAVTSPQNSFTTSAYAQSVNAARPAGFADIVERVKPSVISVRVKVANDRPQLSALEGRNLPPGMEEFFKRFAQPDGQSQGNAPGNSPANPRKHNFSMGQGSGFFITADGYAVTNNHVVDKAESVEVTTDDGKTYPAKVIGTDARTDLALIKVEGRKDFPVSKLADGNPRIGDWVLAVGNPFGLGGTVTAGIVSARGRDIGAGPYDDFIQIDAPVNKGNSGGPTFDVDGNVIGVNTAIFSPSGGSVGIAFAIPAETVKSVVAQLKDKGAVTRGWIGVQIQPVTREIADSLGMKNDEGAIVAEPQAGSPAAKAGIRAGDVIVKVNGDAIKDARMLARRVSSLAPGANAKLDVIRDGKEQQVTLVIGDMPQGRRAEATGDEREPNAAPALGLALAPADKVSGAGEQGVVVTKVDPDGPAAERGFKVGDVILDVGGSKVGNPTAVRKAIADARTGGKKTILMRIKSGEQTRFVAVPVGTA